MGGLWVGTWKGNREGHPRSGKGINLADFA